MNAMLHQKSYEAARKLTPGTVSHQKHNRGIRDGEPVIIAMDALLRYAIRHEQEFESKLADDSFLGEPWLDAIKGVRVLLNGSGHFDGGACEDMFWAAMDAAGFSESDL